MILQRGKLPKRDMMRTAPLGRDNSEQFTLYPYALAYAFRVLKPIIPSLTLDRAAMLYPVLTFIPILILFFLLVRHLTDAITALYACIALSVTPGFIFRTMAGFADRDAFTILLFLLALYLFCRSQRARTFLREGCLALLSGITTGLMGLSWAGVGLLTTIILIWNLLYLLTDRFTGRHYLLYCLWYLPAMGFMLPHPGFHRHLSEPFVWLAIGMPSYLFVVATLYRALRDSAALRRLPLAKRLPPGWYLIGVSSFLGILLILPILGPDWLWGKMLILKDHFFSPLGRNRVMSSVAEMRSSYFTDWWVGFGFFFFISIGGATLLLYRILCGSSVNPWYVLCGFMALMGGVIYSRLFPHIVLNGKTVASNFLYLGAVILFLLLTGGLYLLSHHVTHLLLSYREVENLYWISWIGSDRNEDRLCSLGILPRQPAEEKRLYFRNPRGIAIDDPLEVEGRFYPRRSLLLTDVSVSVKEDGSFGVPQAGVVYRGSYLKLTISEMYSYGKRWYFPDGDLPGCLLLNAASPLDYHDVDPSEIRSATYLPQVARQSLLIKLFLLNEPSEAFQLVYPTSGNPNGPVKIWRIRYPKGVGIVSDYLRLEAPDPSVLRP
jgi:hypothetical protein